MAEILYIFDYMYPKTETRRIDGGSADIIEFSEFSDRDLGSAEMYISAMMTRFLGRINEVQIQKVCRFFLTEQNDNKIDEGEFRVAYNRVKRRRLENIDKVPSSAFLSQDYI